MAWSSVPDKAAGDQFTEQMWDDYIKGNMDELNPFFSAWTSWTPTMTQTVTVSLTNTDSKYLQIGKLVVAYFNVTATSNGTSGGTVVVGFGSGGTALPTARAATAIFGSYRFLDAGNTNYVGTIVGSSTTNLTFYKDGDGNPLGPTNPVQVTTNDVMYGFVVYESAS